MGDGQLVDRFIGAHDETHIQLLAIGALGFGLAACGGSNAVNTNPVSGSGGTNTTQYQQIELLSRPAVKSCSKSSTITK